MSYTPSGIPKFDNLDNIKNIQNSKDGDIVIAKDTGLMYQYKDGSWTTSNNTFTNPSQFSNWVLLDTKTFNNSIPSYSCDISNCTKFRIEVNGISTSNYIKFNFGSDTSANYSFSDIRTAGSSVTYDGINRTFGVIGSGSNYYGIFEFNKNSKLGSLLYGSNGTLPTACLGYLNYKGIDSLNTLNISADGGFNGIIKIYKWVDQIQPVELSTYELISEITLNNQTFNDVTIPIDDTIDTVIVDTSLCATSVDADVRVYINNDRDNNYNSQTIYGTNTQTISVNNNIGSGIMLGNWWSSNTTLYTNCYSKLYLNLQQNNVSGILNCSLGQRYSESTPSAIYDSNSRWTGTSKVTNLVISTVTGKTYTGTIRVYKLAKSHLISTNPNLLTIYSKYISNNSIQIQPGEIEINGTICQVSTPTTITLSENLKSGLSEAPSTLYYLYAVKSNNRNVTYMFDTIAPTMDRYGNIESTFQDCDLSKALFHPTLGLNYRYIGQIYNNSSNDILPFDKMKPGYWEGTWTQFSWNANTVLTLYHGLGRLINSSELKFKQSLTDNVSYSGGFHISGTNYYGYQKSFTSDMPDTITTLSISVYGNGAFYKTSWQKTGYYKLILKG